MSRVKGFTRKGGEKVRGFTRKAPKLSAGERKRRAGQMLETGSKWAGKVGFTACVKRLSKVGEITDAKKVCGKLKGEAKRKGILSKAHPYTGRRKKKG